MKKNHSLTRKIMLAVAMLVLSSTMFKLSAQIVNPICAGETYEIAVKIKNATTLEASWKIGNEGTGTVPQPTVNLTDSVWTWLYPTTSDDAGNTIIVNFTTNVTDEYCDSLTVPFEFTVLHISEGTQIAVTGNEAEICSGETAQLTVSASTVTKPVFYWYSTVNATEWFHKGDTYNTPQLTSTTTYYVSVEGEDHCEGEANSTGRKAVTVTVNPRPDAPSFNDTEVLAVCEEEFFDVNFLKGFINSAHLIEFYTDAACTIEFNDTIAKLLETPYTFYAISRNANTLCATADTNALVITVDVNARPTATISTQDGKVYICVGESINATFLDEFITSAHTITYFTNSACTDTLKSITASLTPGTHTIYAIAKNEATGCETLPSKALVITVYVNDRPDAPVFDVPADKVFICMEEEVNETFLLTLVTGDYDIEFYMNEECTEALDPFTAKLEAGSYTIWAISRDEATGCATFASSALEINLKVKSCRCDYPAEIEIKYQGVQRGNK